MPQTANRITPDHRARAQATRQDWRSIEPAVKDACTRLADAIKNGDLRGMMALRRSVELEAQRAATLVSQSDRLMTVLREVQNADGFEQTGRELEKMTADLGAVSAAATEAFRAGRKLMASADDAMKQAEASDAEHERRWAKADAYLRAHCGERAAAMKAMRTMAAQADKAVAARDAAALATTQKAAAAAVKFSVPLSKLRNEAEMLQKAYETLTVAAALRTQFEADRKNWSNLLRAAEADELQMALDRDVIATQKVEPRDARKAAQLLGIGSSDIAKLAKVLEADAAAIVKGLEALRKQLKLEMPAKDMFATLRRAQLV